MIYRYSGTSVTATYRPTGSSRPTATVQGREEAQSEDELRLLLRERGIQVERVWTRRLDQPLTRARVNRKLVTQFTQSFAELLNSQLNIADALRTLYSQTRNPTLRKTIQEVLSDVRGGAHLADAMARHPKIFDSVYIRVVRAGEAANALGEMLTDWGESMEHMQEIRREIIRGTLYPSIMGSVMFTIGMGMLTFVVPKFETMFTGTGTPMKLPLITELLLGASRLVRTASPAIALIAIATIFVLMRAKSYPRLKLRIDTLLLRLPVAGPLIRASAMAVFCKVFSTVHGNRVQIVDAIGIAADTVANSRIAGAMRLAAADVATGIQFTHALNRSNEATPAVLSLAEVGLETSRLPEQMRRAASIHTKEVRHWVAVAISLLEPAMVLALAVGGGIVVVGIYLPFYMGIRAMGGH